MVARGAFVAGSAAVLAAAGSARALAFVDTTVSGTPHESRDQAKATLDAVSVIAATHLAVRTVWRPPPEFPEIAPIAYYPGRGADERYPNEAVIWLNPDHPELISPRVSRVTDEIPLFTELLLASVDVRSRGVPSLGLEQLDSSKRRAAATAAASNAAVVARYSPYETVDDAEFARRAFAFAVLRQLTPGIGGVAPIVTPASAMPRDEPFAFYAGRDADPHVPHGWGVVRTISLSIADSPRGYDAWVRAFVLATADQQPAMSAVKRAYDTARAADDAAQGDRWAARRAFAAKYANQVAAFFGR